ncbi:hypothetical protein ACFXKD_20630 [Nocardiopsis aegyptia]|uniref:hypothetical protein n=1 Tax=Nocardiopsis aegyptia TaxID=220378 RepID=UPI003670DF17
MSAVAETSLEGIIAFFSDAIVSAIGETVASLGTMWVHIDTPNLTDNNINRVEGQTAISRGEHAPNDQVEQLLQYGIWIALGVCVLSIIVLGARMAIARRAGEGATHLGKVGAVLGAVVLISAASAIVMRLMGDSAYDGGGGPTMYLQNSLWWYTGGAAIMSVVIGGAKMAWEQRAEPGKELIKSLFTLVIVAGAGLTIINIAIQMADEFSVWIIGNSYGTDSDNFSENVTAMLALSAVTQIASPIVPIIIIVLGIIALLASVMQVMLMVVRIGMLVILSGILPLAASFTNTEMGRSWFKKCVGWLVAFILYKPAAAIIYAAAFQLVGSDLFGEDGLLQFIVGLTLMVVALVAMPALLRFTVPMVGGMAAGAGAGAAAAGAAADLPSGAMKISNQGGGGGGSGGGSGGGKGGGSASSSPTGAANTSGSSAAQGGGQMASQGGQMAGTGAKAGAAAGAGVATAGVATAVMAAAETAKKAGEAVQQTVQQAAEGSESGEEGPRGSR